MHVYEQLSDGKIIPQHYVECKKPNPDGTPKLRPTWISDFKKWHAEGRDRDWETKKECRRL